MLALCSSPFSAVVSIAMVSFRGRHPMSVVTRNLISSDQRSGVDIGKGGREGMRYNGTLNECAPTRGRWRNALMKIKIDDENKILSLCDISCPCTNKRRILDGVSRCGLAFFALQTTYRPERVTRHYCGASACTVGGDERWVVGDVLISRLLNAHPCPCWRCILGTISQNLILLTASLPYLYVTLCLPFSTSFLT